MFEILEGGKQPTRATKYSACVDLYAREDVVMLAGETKIIPLGVKVDLNKLKQTHSNQFPLINEFKNEYEKREWVPFLSSHYLALHIRSGLAAKGLVQNNGVGIIDLDYPNEIGLIVSNSFGEYALKIKAGDRVAQCTLMEHKGYLMGINSKDERQGGFGSTGS